MGLGAIHVDDQQPADRPQDHGQARLRPLGKPGGQFLLRGQAVLERLPSHAGLLGARILRNDRPAPALIGQGHVEHRALAALHGRQERQQRGRLSGLRHRWTPGIIRSRA